MSQEIFNDEQYFLQLTQSGYFDMVELGGDLFDVFDDTLNTYEVNTSQSIVGLAETGQSETIEPNTDHTSEPPTFEAPTTRTTDSSSSANATEPPSTSATNEPILITATIEPSLAFETTNPSTSETTESPINTIADKTPTFLNISMEEKEHFLSTMKNKNTLNKTESCLKQLKRWMAQAPRNDARDIWTIMPAELDNMIGSFLLSIRKADGSEYEPDTLTSYHRGIDRVLREQQYPYSIVQDKEFSTSRRVLSSKRKELKSKGKGNRPNAAEPLTIEEREKLRQSGIVGTDSPKKLLNLIWLNNTILFGLRGGNENRQLCWGDIELKQNDRGREYIEYNERLTKTRTGERTTELRPFKPKQFAHETQETCPVYAYKVFASHRPTDMCQPDSPFYLAINYTRLPNSDKWYKSQPLGVNSLNNLMKNMANDGNLNGKKTNHSARKTTCTDLLHSGIAPTTIQQLSAHKNVQSVNNYAKASNNMQENMSDILSNNPNPPKESNSLVSHRPHKTSPSSILGSSSVIPNPSISRSVSLAKGVRSELDMFSVFTGQILQNSKLMNCPITIINKVAHSSPTKQKKRKRILPIIESDSD